MALKHTLFWNVTDDLLKDVNLLVNLHYMSVGVTNLVICSLFITKCHHIFRGVITTVNYHFVTYCLAWIVLTEYWVCVWCCYLSRWFIHKMLYDIYILLWLAEMLYIFIVIKTVTIKFLIIKANKDRRCNLIALSNLFVYKRILGNPLDGVNPPWLIGTLIIKKERVTSVLETLHAAVFQHELTFQGILNY